MGGPPGIEIDEEELARRLAPRDDPLVREALLESEGQLSSRCGTARFTCEHGPFRSYERRVRWERLEPGRVRFGQSVRFWPAVPVFAPLFHLLLRGPLRSGAALRGSPIWALPDRLSAEQSRVVAAMCLFHVVGGIMFSFLTNVLTFISADLGDGSAGEQSVVLAVARIGAVGTIAVMALADRAGRRRVALWSAYAAVALTLGSALAPDLVYLTVLQTVARNLAIAAMLASDTLSVEQIPAGSRAAVQGLGALSYGLGAGLVVLALPLADISAGSWRLVFLVSVLCVPLLAIASRHLPESARFVNRDRFSPRARRVAPGRFLFVGLLLFLLNAFVAPSSQLQNDYLRSDHGFAGSRLTLFIAVTSIPGLFGILVGGRIADRRSRRVAIVPGFLALGVFGALFFASGGVPMWLAATLAAGLGTVAVPALGVLAPEMFPTARRGAARGALSAVATGGSIVGLLLAGVLVDRLGYGSAFTWLAIGPVAGALLALRVPETSGVELEDLNETRPGAPDRASRGSPR
ncbi:MAG: MFS transporter [Microthrixaceae bacterium]